MPFGFLPPSILVKRGSFPEGHPIRSAACAKDKKLSDLAMKVWAVATRIGLGGLGVHPI